MCVICWWLVESLQTHHTATQNSNPTATQGTGSPSTADHGRTQSSETPAPIPRLLRATPTPIPPAAGRPPRGGSQRKSAGAWTARGGMYVLMKPPIERERGRFLEDRHNTKHDKQILVKILKIGIASFELWTALIRFHKFREHPVNQLLKAILWEDCFMRKR